MSAFLPALASAAIGGIGGMLGRDESRKQPASKEQKQRLQLIDELMRSISGNGQFSDLFNMDESTFQTSFVDPAKNTFQNQIAPEIQQSFIAGGQQRGTGLDDTLSRAGVDLDQILNQQFAQMQQTAQQNKIGGINTLLGSNSGVPGPAAPQQSASNAFFQGASGSASNFANPTSDFFKNKRKGFEG